MTTRSDRRRSEARAKRRARGARLWWAGLTGEALIGPTIQERRAALEECRP